MPTTSVGPVERAIQSCCLSWGGAFNLLVPCDGHIDPEWRAIFESYDPDLIYDLSGLPLDQHERLSSTGRSVQPSENLEKVRAPGAFVYSMAAAFLNEWRPDSPRVVIPVVSRDHPLWLQVLARFGSLNEAGLQEPLKWSGLRSDLSLEMFFQFITAELDGHGARCLIDYPLKGLGYQPEDASHMRLTRITRLELPMWFPGRPPFARSEREREVLDRRDSPLVLVTGAQDSISDLCLFWAIAAHRTDTTSFPLWIPLETLRQEEGQEVLQIALERTQPLLRARPHLPQDLYVVSTSIGRREIENSLQLSRGTKVVCDAIRDFIPPNVQRGYRTELELIFVDGKASVPPTANEKLLAFGDLERLAQEIEIERYRLPAVSGLRHSIFGIPWRITNAGFEASVSAGYVNRLNPMVLPSSWRVLEGILKSRGYSVAPSPKGRLALGLLSLLGSLDAVRLLTSSRVFRLLEEMCATQTRRRLQRLVKAALTDLSGDDFDQLLSVLEKRLSDMEQERVMFSFTDAVKHLGRNRAEPVMQWLIERGVVLRGTELVCNSCGLRRWYYVDTLSAQFRCDGCRATSATPLDLTATAWRYRVNELYGQAYDQGVLPHIMLAYHKRADPLSSRYLGFFPGVDIGSEDGTANELDYVEIHDARLEIAECKNSALHMTSDEAEKLLAVVAALGDELVGRVLLVTLGDQPQEKIVEMFQQQLDDRFELYDASNLLDREPMSDSADDPDEYLGRSLTLLGAF